MPNTRDPLARQASLVRAAGNFELANRAAARDSATGGIARGRKRRGLIRDAAIAAIAAAGARFLGLRESFSEAQKGAGGSIKHDISVPVARIPNFLSAPRRLSKRSAQALGRCRSDISATAICTTMSRQPEGMDKARYLALWDPMSDAVHALVAEMDGSISAEHGIGQMKRDGPAAHKSPVELDMMRAIKKALDPKGILNPGKVL